MILLDLTGIAKRFGRLSGALRAFHSDETGPISCHIPTCLLAGHAGIVSRFRAEESSRGTPNALIPTALEVLKRMSTTLGASKAFTFHSRIVLELPIRTGQFITLFSSAEVSLKRPDKLRARLSGEAPHFDFYFDGTTASAFAPKDKVYSTTKLRPPSTRVLPELQQETGIRFVSAPLLFSDPYEVLTRRLISGVVVGSAMVNRIACYHLAFQIAWGVNWEIWIEAGKRALPWRLAVTFTDRTNFPTDLGRIHAVEPSSTAGLS